MPYPSVDGGVAAVVFPDPIVMVRGWLRRFVGLERVYLEQPADFESKLPFVIVRESGGPGVHDRVYARVRLQFEVWAQDSMESAKGAQNAAALLRAWPEYEDVWNPQIIQDPTYMPDPDTGIPVHRLAAEISFVGEATTILSSEGA